VRTSRCPTTLGVAGHPSHGSVSSGQRFTEEEEKITEKWIDWYFNLCGEHAQLYNEFLSDEDPHKKYSAPSDFESTPRDDIFMH
jgi:hypothetical protein